MILSIKEIKDKMNVANNTIMSYQSVKRMWFFVVVLLLLVTWVAIAQASSSSVSKSNFLSGVTTQGIVEVFTGLGSNTVSCYLRSSTSPSTIINVIGWTWWQCSSLDSSGNIVGTPVSGSGAFASASSLDNWSGLTGSFSGVANVRMEGTHDFNHTGASQWQPYNYVYLN